MTTLESVFFDFLFLAGCYALLWLVDRINERFKKEDRDGRGD